MSFFFELFSLLLHLHHTFDPSLQSRRHNDTTVIASVVSSFVFAISALLFFWRRRIRQTENQPCCESFSNCLRVFRRSRLFCLEADNVPPLPSQTATLEVEPIEGPTHRKSANSHVDDPKVQRVYSGNSQRLDMTGVAENANSQHCQTGDI